MTGVEGDTHNNDRIARNSLFLYIRMIVVMLVGLYTSRVVLNVLGISDFGISNVVVGFVSLFAFLNATFTSSIQRFYNYEGGKAGEEGFQRVFSAGMRVHLILALVVFVLLESFGTWYVNHVMVLPEERLFAANVVFQFAILNLLLVILQIPFSAAIIAKEKLDFYALVNIVEVVLKLVLVILLPHVPFDKLIAFASIQLFVQIANFVLYYSYSKIKFNCIKWTNTIDRSLLKGMLSFSGWTLLGSFSFMFKVQGVNLVLNSFFGIIVNAARGVAYQIYSAVSNFSSNITMSFRPQLVQSFAKNDLKRTYALFSSQSRLCYIISLMLITPMILEMDYLLHLWLGNVVPEYSIIFSKLVLIDTLINTLNTPVTQVVFATGRIKGYHIGGAIINILLIPLCWIFLKMGFDASIVFVLTIIVSIICHLVCLIIMHHVFPYSYKEYLQKIIMPCAAMTVLVPLLPFAIRWFLPGSLIRLLLVSLASLAVTVALAYSFFLNISEKELVHRFTSKFFKTRISG